MLLIMMLFLLTYFVVKIWAITINYSFSIHDIKLLLYLICFSYNFVQMANEQKNSITLIINQKYNIEFNNITNLKYFHQNRTSAQKENKSIYFKKCHIIDKIRIILTNSTFHI